MLNLSRIKQRHSKKCSCLSDGQVFSISRYRTNLTPDRLRLYTMRERPGRIVGDTELAGHPEETSESGDLLNSFVQRCIYRSAILGMSMPWLGCRIRAHT